ncbi:MAG: 4-diphosphocytidyl-2-C-methyl-D-erythritol kinase [Ignavibacteriae bacterium]|nr:MAG: 4-diphosphocytidyl-2-C-methyl-D-erythritol kinase [Ignavibacteriota bacterium]
MITLKAYAKINIGLRILNKRPDGYHNIETIFHRINLYDILEISENDEISLNIQGINLPTNEDNICIKTVKLFQNNFGIRSGIRLKLIKNIPIGAGLGGGSSDAGILLKALPKFFNIQISNHSLNKLAQQLGADVPYFLNDGSAYATEKGDKLEYFKLSLPYWIITITPPIQISSKWAYENFTIDNSIKIQDNLKNLLLNNINNKENLKEFVKNDFEKLVFDKYPEIKVIKEKLYSYGVDYASLSGSGSTVFAFCKEEELFRKIYEYFKKDYYISITEPNFEP